MRQTFTLFILLFTLIKTNAQITSTQKVLTVGKEVGWSRQKVIKCADNGYLVAGNFEGIPTQEDDDLCVIKTDATGNLKWRHVFKKAYTHTSHPTFVLETPEHDYLIGINAKDNYDHGNIHYLYKLDANGNLLWSREIRLQQYVSKETYDYSPVYGLVTADKNYLIVGRQIFYSQEYKYVPAVFAMMIDKDGNLKWVRDYFKRGRDIQPIGILENKDKSFTIGCINEIIKIDSIGNFISGKTYSWGSFSTIIKNADNSYYLSGVSSSYSNYSSYLIKINNNGAILWARSLKGSWYTSGITSSYMFKNSASLADSGCFLAGLDSYSLYLSRFDKSGNLLWKKKFSDSAHDFASFGETSLIQTKDGYLYYTGKYDSHSYYNGHSYYNLNEFGNTDTICNTITDTASILVNADNAALAQNLILLTDSIGYFLNTTVTTVAETDTTNMLTNCSNIILPLQLLSFSASHNGKNNLLKWSTSQEINTSHFEIQRSSNSRDFNTIGTVQSYNNGKAKNDYTFTDAQPLKAINYYRLKMIDKDGQFTYSAIKNVNNNGSLDITIYPNPVHQNLTLSFNTEKPMDLQIEIVNAEGKKVYTSKMQLPYGASLQNINVGALKAGNYFVKCIMSDGQIGLKFVKQ